jgi:UDPglucose--hexose-1-phosphate uridylyltransferase
VRRWSSPPRCYAGWHLELLPRLTVFAALELGAGYFVNTIPPEQAAAQLRR